MLDTMHSILSFFTKNRFLFCHQHFDLNWQTEIYLARTQRSAMGGARKGNISLSPFQSNFPGFPDAFLAILVDSSTFPLVYRRILNLSDGKRRSWSSHRQKIRHSDEFM